MHAVEDMDREAAEELRILLADISGFWHRPGDTGPICAALARHRHLAEQRLLQQMNNAARVARDQPRAVESRRLVVPTAPPAQRPVHAVG